MILTPNEQKIVAEEVQAAEKKILQRIGKVVLLALKGGKPITEDAFSLMQYVAAALGMTVDDVYAATNARVNTDLRGLVVWAIREYYPDLTMANIAQLIGRRDHTRVSGLVRRHYHYLHTKEREYVAKYKQACAGVQKWVTDKTMSDAKREDSDIRGIEVGTDGRGREYSEGMAAGTTGAGRAVYQ